MKEKFRQNRLLIVLLLILALVQLILSNPLLVERLYANGVYPHISRFFRFVFGWIPFSIGDIIYAGILVFVLYKIVKLTISWKTKKRRTGFWTVFKKLSTGLVITYLLFILLWGANYHRAGSAYQLQLEPSEYVREDLRRLFDTLNQRIHQTVPQIKPADSAVWTNFETLKKEAIQSYQLAAQKDSFLTYATPSIKKMLYDKMGGYGGFSGYLNPFTAEAQIDFSMPAFSRSFVMCHEMAHQIGYAAEEEANMVGYLAGKRSSNPAVRYSVYNDMLAYAGRELFRADSIAYKSLKDSIHPLVKQHYAQSRDYYNSFKNTIQPISNWWYDQFLKANKQEKGLYSYSYVTAWLIAYAKKYGWDQL